MPYTNSRLYALLALGLSLVAVPSLHAQQASVAPAAIRGDVDGDGRVTRADADAVRAYLVRGTLPAGRSIMPAGDANGDGRVTAADAALISRFAAGVDVSRFGVGRPVSEGGGRKVSPQGTLMFTEYECGVDSRTRTLNCEVVGAGVEGGARSDVLLLGSGAKFNGSPTSSYVTGDTRDTMKVTVSIRNLLPQPIGTTDGVTGDTVRVVFTGWRTTTVSSLAYSVADVVTANGTATFTDSVNSATPVPFTNRQYMDFPGLIAPNDTSQAREIKIAYQKGLSGAFKFTYRIWSRVQYNKGNVVIAGADSIVGAGQTLPLSGSSYTVVGAPMASEAYTWQSSNPGVATVSPSGVVTGVSGGTTTITATANADNARGGTRVIRVIQANLENVGVTGNVRLSSPASVLVNDSIHPNVRLAFYGWNGSPGVTQQGGTLAMDTTVAGGANRGKFTYNPPAGFEGADSLAYVIQAGTAVDTGKVALNVAGMIWFVDANAGSPCTSRASGCGRLTTPYSTLAAFNAENNGTGNNPAAGDAIFLFESGTTYTGPVTLLGQQKLIGQDAGAALATLAGITLANGSDALPAMNPAGSTATIGGGAGGVVLGADNLLRGFTITTSGGAALSGTGFGTPTIAEVSIAATAGPALSLTNGTLNGTFPSVTSTNSTGRGISLTAVGGTPTFTAGSISGSAQAALFVSGGSVGFTWPGSIGQSSNTPLLAVAGGHSGTLTFSGALTSTAGPGMQFNDADGVYNLNGTANLSGDSAAVDITNGSGGSFNFNGGTQITNAAGAANSALYVYGSAPTLVSYAGSITKSGSSAGPLVELGEMTGGTVTFTGTSTLSSTSSAGTGILFSNVAATVGFNGTTTLNGGDAGIDILAASIGTFTFGANTLVQNPTGTAFNVNASAPAVTFNGSLIRTANNALLVDLTTVAAGKTITFDPVAGTDSLYATIGDGIQLSNVDGAVDFNGRVRLAGGNAGVDIINGSSGNIDFDAATIVNPTGDALRIFNGSGGDQATDVSFAGDISANAGRPVLVEDVGSGTVAVSASINATGQGLLAQNNSGGTITFSSATQVLNTAGNAAVSLLNNSGSTVNFTGGALTVTTAAGAGFNATGGGTVNVEGTTNTITSTTGTPVSISSTTIGANGVRFRSVSANGASNGIFLNNTGASGGSFRVDGTGTVGSGGSILNTSGADGATAGNGVYLNNVRNVVLSGMIINDHPNFGIFGQTVNGFTLDNSRLAGTHGTNIGLDEAVISITGLDGQAVFSNDSISGGIEDNVRILNHGVVSAATDSILFNNVRMGHVNATSGNTALLVRVADGSSNRVRIRNSVFHGSRGGSTFHLNVVNTATARLALDANTFNNTQTQISGAGGVLITASGTAASVPTLTYDITGNTFRGSRTVALNINKDVGLAVINGNISGNTIGDAAVTNSGSSEASGIQLRHQGGGTHRATVTNNQIYQYNNYGIILEEGDAVAGGGHGRMDVTVTGNTVSNPGTLAFSWNGLHANIGTVTDDAHILCLAASGNSMDNAGTASQDIRLRQRMKTTIILPGYGGSANDNTAVNNFVKANNGNGAGLTVVSSNSIGVASPNGPGNGFINGTCNAPTF